MEKIISVLLGMILFMKEIFWIKTGKSGDKTKYILGVFAIVVGILMLGYAILSFM